MSFTKTYTDYEELERDFKADILTPQMLKASLSKMMNRLLEVSNEAIQRDCPEEWNIILEARKKALKKKPNT